MPKIGEWHNKINRNGMTETISYIFKSINYVQMEKAVLFYMYCAFLILHVVYLVRQFEMILSSQELCNIHSSDKIKQRQDKL